MRNYEFTSNKFNVHRINSEPKISSEKHYIKILTKMYNYIQYGKRLCRVLLRNACAFCVLITQKTSMQCPHSETKFMDLVHQTLQIHA
jgi:hypothetical protein